MNFELIWASRLVRAACGLVVCSALSSCAILQSPGQTGVDLWNAGRFQQAYDVLQGCASRGDPVCINNIGVMYQRGYMNGGPNLEIAAQYYTEAARYGLPMARQNLEAIGKPVPVADLQESYEAQQTAERVMMLQALSGMASSYANSRRAASTPVPVVPSPTTSRAVQQRTCTGDWQCGGGEQCYRPEGSISQGTCAHLVDKVGTRVPGVTPASAGIHPLTACHYDTECSPGFVCRKLPNEMVGMCMK